VFERDGWTCGLCSEPVDPALSWPDPQSASLDHVLPLSRGGSHTMANVQLAHLGCNVEKGAAVA
jgi:5-methylcytosine-specific restriction endonuclease McrA